MTRLFKPRLRPLLLLLPVVPNQNTSNSFGPSPNADFLFSRIFNRVCHFELNQVEVQGVSNVRFYMALRGRSINNFLELWWLVASGGLHFCVSSTSVQKIDIGWPQQPQTDNVSDISKILNF